MTSQPPPTPTIPSITLESKIHPATTVSNIKNYVPIILEIESSQYATWATLFKNNCKAFLVHDHLSPKPQATATASSTTTQPNDDWDRLDAIVLQWIYRTISNDLLHTIINKTATAYDAWKAIEDLFQDNKSSRAIHLMHKFSNTRLDGFPNVSAYCQELKVLADQLANVNALVDNDRLVLQLISGLNEQYEGIATILQQQEPLPSFYTARSKLIQVKTRKAEQALHSAKAASSALLATTGRQSSDQNRSDDRSYGRGRGRSSGRRGRGRSGTGRGRYPQNYNYPFYPPWMAPWFPQPDTWPNSISHPAQQPNGWPNPPCPYPTANRNPPNNSAQQPGLLGPHPQQSKYAAYSPTDIEQAMYTMSLTQPDPTQYMDTRATSTMSHEQGPQDAGFPSTMQQKR
ncbi:putative RNA-directed DNA polymerase [Helianthus debilis subsp. tardiflorus]